MAGGGLVDARLQGLLAGAGLPVDVARAVPRHVRPHPCQAGRVVEEAAPVGAVAEGVPGGEAEGREGQHLGVDQEPVERPQVHLPGGEAEGVAAGEAHGAQGEGPPRPAAEAVAQAHPLEPAQGEHLAQQGPPGAPLRAQRSSHQLEANREAVVRLQPGEGEELAVVDLHAEGQLFAEGGPLLSQVAPVGHAAQGVAPPQTHGEGGHQQAGAEEGQGAAAQHQGGEQEQRAGEAPGLVPGEAAIHHVSGLRSARPTSAIDGRLETWDVGLRTRDFVLHRSGELGQERFHHRRGPPAA